MDLRRRIALLLNSLHTQPVCTFQYPAPQNKLAQWWIYGKDGIQGKLVSLYSTVNKQKNPGCSPLSLPQALCTRGKGVRRRVLPSLGVSREPQTLGPASSCFSVQSWTWAQKICCHPSPLHYAAMRNFSAEHPSSPRAWDTSSCNSACAGVYFRYIFFKNFFFFNPHNHYRHIFLPSRTWNFHSFFARN